MVKQDLMDLKFYSTNMLLKLINPENFPFLTKFVLWQRTAKLRSAWRSTVDTTGNPHEGLGSQREYENSAFVAQTSFEVENSSDSHEMLNVFFSLASA